MRSSNTCHRLSVEISHEESAAQQIIAQLQHLVIGCPIRQPARHTERPVVDLVAIVKIYALFDGPLWMRVKRRTAWENARSAGDNPVQARVPVANLRRSAAIPVIPPGGYTAAQNANSSFPGSRKGARGRRTQPKIFAEWCLVGIGHSH